jgi:uncharacterized protein GlcG (DUF336 family)
MDGAALVSIEVAQNKAYTALFGMPSKDFYNFIKDDPALLSGSHTFLASPSSVVVYRSKSETKSWGGIGVSGGTVEQDVACAQAGLDAVKAE